MNISGGSASILMLVLIIFVLGFFWLINYYAQKSGLIGRPTKKSGILWLLFTALVILAYIAKLHFIGDGPLINL